MKTILTIFVALAITAPYAAAGNQGGHSKLWGANGELWTPQGRLPDFSRAGYHCGDTPVPSPKTAANVKDFGAKGDGKADDTEAFKRAISAAVAKGGGAVDIPKGKYILKDIIWIKHSNVVLRGAGKDKTILFFPKPLQDILPNMSHTTGGRPTSAYSWSGGLIWVKGYIGPKKLAAVTRDAKRGTKTITVENTSKLHVGDMVQITQTDDKNNSLTKYLYQGDCGDIAKVGRVSVKLPAKVLKVRGNSIILDRPLRIDVRKSWSAAIAEFAPSVSEVGVENLAIVFPNTPYKGHFTEKGYNAIAMNGVANCWIKNVAIINADSGIFLSGSSFCTVSDLLIKSNRKKASRGCTGHHGVQFGSDCLLTNFRIETSFIHDITVGYLASGNVSNNGYGANLSLDHHRKAPFANLFSNLDAGIGRDIWRCGGGRHLGKHAAAWNTYWNIRASNPLPPPNKKFGTPMINLVGLYTKAAEATTPKGAWFEVFPTNTLQPPELYKAQLEKRRGKH